jgi:hypothetical protein
VRYYFYIYNYVEEEEGEILFTFGTTLRRILFTFITMLRRRGGILC